MYLMLQQDQADDYVIATGETHSVQEFLELACQAAGLDNWQNIINIILNMTVRPKWTC